MRRKKRPSLVDAVKEMQPGRNRGPLPWFQRVAPEYAAELEEMRQAFHRGEFGSATRNAVAEKLAEVIRSRGIADVYTQGVAAWLKNNN